MTNSNSSNSRGGYSRSSNSRHSNKGGFSGGSRGGGYRGGSSSSRGSSSSSRGGGSGSRGRGRGGNSRRSGSGRKMATFNPSQFINKNPISIKQDIVEIKNTFETFGLNEKLVRNVTESGITIPSPIQDQAIPEIMKGNDVVGLAETGTGKTAAFLLPTINRSLANDNQITLILAPTRELALQIQAELRKLSEGLRIYSTICVGGMPVGPQIRQLKKRNQFIIGTPGRTLDLFKRKIIPANLIKTVILDEADRMLDMGFINDMKKILSMIPANENTLLFSATMDKKTEGIVKDFLKDPVTISVKKKDTTDSIRQDVVMHTNRDKYETLEKMLSEDKFRRVIVFGSMKHSVEALAGKLNQSKISTESIHGNKNHRQRQRALIDFKSGKVRVLVATDVAARGIHVDNVSHVINYDLPNTFEDYLHRIGRTGRGDKFGEALTFVSR